MASMSRHRGSSFLAVVSWVVRFSDPFLLRFVNRSGNCCSSPAFFSLAELSTCVFGPLLTLGNTGLSGFRSPLATARVDWAARHRGTARRSSGGARRLGHCLVQRVSQVPFLLVRRKVEHVLPLSLFACSACGSFDVFQIVFYHACSLSLVVTDKV